MGKRPVAGWRLAAGGPAGGWRLAAGGGKGLLVLWSAVVFGVFLGDSLPVALLGASVVTGVLGAASAYAFAFTGFRLARRLESRFPGDADPFDRTLLEFAMGLGAAIGVLILAGVGHLYSRPFAFALLGASLVGPHAAFLRALQARWVVLRATGRPPGFLVALLVAVGVMTILESLAPPSAQDALVYHLALPARYVDEGGLVRVPGNVFGQFPQNLEMLFTFGLLLHGGTLAQWYHWLLGAASVAAVAALARALAGRGGTLAATLFATVPSAALIASWAYVDLGVVFFGTLSVLAFVRWSQATAMPWLVLSALCAGLAAGTKYTAGLQGLLVAGGAAVLLRARGRPLREAFAVAAGAAALVALVACPWWIKNLVTTGNPLHPFVHGLFGGDDWDVERARALSQSLAEWGGERGFLETLLLPWRLTMEARFASHEGFDGMIGPAFLIGLPFCILAAWVSPSYRVAVFFILAHGLFWAATSRQVRFLLPTLAVAAALIAAFVEGALASGWVRRCARSLLVAAAASNVVLSALHFAHQNPLPVVLGLESEGQYLARSLPGGDYQVFEFIARELPAESHILLAALGNPGYLVKRKYYSDAVFENRTLIRILEAAAGPDEVLRRFQERGFTHLLFRAEHVFDPLVTKSDIGLEEQAKLKAFLDRHARRLAEANGTLLYEVGGDLGG